MMLARADPLFAVGLGLTILSFACWCGALMPAASLKTYAS